MDKQVQNLLKIIRFAPPLAIIIASALLITLLYYEQKRELQKELELIEKQFMHDEKERIKARILTVHNVIKDEQKNIEIALKKKLKYDVTNVYRIINSIYRENINKKSKNEIIQEIKSALRDIRFNNGRTYIALSTMTAVSVLQPLRRDREGFNKYDIQDGNGKYFMKEIVNIAKSKKAEGYSEYYFNKLNDSKKEYKKISYIKAFKELDLIIIIGDYISDFKLDVQKKVLKRFYNLKYKNDGYIVAINFNGKVIYHPSKKILNHNIFKEKKFSHIKNDLKSLIDRKGKDIGEFLSLSPKVIESRDTKEIKVLFAKRFDEWKWIISTSFKLSDANNIIEERKSILQNKYKHYKNDIIFYGLVLTLLLLVLSYLLSKSIEKKFLNYKQNLEEQILENEKQKETLLEAQKVARIGDWKLDIKNHKAFWSDEVINIFGLKNIEKDDFGPEYIKNMIVEEDVSCFMDSITNCINEKADHKCTYRIKKPDGEIRWINCRGKLNKKEHFILGTVQDITESKKLEIEKHQQEELLYQQSKMAAMGEMLGNIAHQWRQPLSAISSSATGVILKSEMNLINDKELKHTMKNINDSTQYLSQTIDDFRGFFNPLNNKRSEFFVADIIKKTLSLVTTQFHSKDIQIIQDIENCKLASIENEIIQVLINILNNAKDILESKVKTKRLIFINTYKKENDLYIEILDNGGGIDKDIKDRIFEPYFTTKHKSQGTGIGLYMSQNIIRNHLNGDLIVSNEEYLYQGLNYTGAKFTIKIAIN